MLSVHAPAHAWLRFSFKVTLNRYATVCDASVQIKRASFDQVDGQPDTWQKIVSVFRRRYAALGTITSARR
jgi:hypothetical protein